MYRLIGISIKSLHRGAPRSDFSMDVVGARRPLRWIIS